MTISTLVKGFAGALTAAAICATAAIPADAATNSITLTNAPTQLETPETLVFTARSTESVVIAQGYQVNNLETLTNNVVTLSGGGPNLLGSGWQFSFAAAGSNAYTFDDGTAIPALGFGAQNPPDMDTIWQTFATVPGESYTYTFDYSNNTHLPVDGATESQLVVTFTAVPEASTWAMLLFGFMGLGLVSYRARRAAISIG
jgi:hypothetical protein